MICWLDPRDPTSPFPSPERALVEPDGLLAAGGDLHPERLLRAYRSGIFPWYEQGQPILWWSPEPRAVLYPQRLHISRRLRRTLRTRPYRISFDLAFEHVIDACAAPRVGSAGTWITREMRAAYCQLHACGHAHSIEVWGESGRPIGGIYGVAQGRVFFGESMFSRERDASKIALAHLARHLLGWGYRLIDCQLPSGHLMRLGAELIPRRQFLALLGRWGTQAQPPAAWATQDSGSRCDWTE